MKFFTSLALLLSSTASAMPHFGRTDKGTDGPFNTTRHYTTIGNKTYHYLESHPTGEVKDTVLLMHGFPDLSYGWRYQVPYLTSLGYHCIVPDMLGYGRTSAPSDMREYRMKSVASDMVALIDSVVGNDTKVIIGGHDWGSYLAWRMGMYYPDNFKGIFGVAVPYLPPSATYYDMAVLVAAGVYPTFGYQLQFRNSSIDAEVEGPTKIKEVLLALYGATTPEGEPGFLSTEGLLLDNLPLLGSSPLVSDSDIDYYVSEYVKNTMSGPFSWYRTAKYNYEDEVSFAVNGYTFAMPALFIEATQDTAILPSYSKGMENYFDNLTRTAVNSSHWALWQAASQVNGLLESWMGGI